MGRFPVKLKHCPRCERDLPSHKFGKNVQAKDGKYSYCKECTNQSGRNYYKQQMSSNLQNFRDRKSRIRRKFSLTPRGSYWMLKYNAKKKGIPFDMNIEDFVLWYSSQLQSCHYCGLPFMMGSSYHQHPMARTFDRKDNSRGYELGNVVLSCRRCNTVKGYSFTEQEMLEIAQKYLKNRCGDIV